MHRPRLSLIAAVAKNGVIGVKNTLPWSLPEDMKRFRELTEGHVVIMGKNTFRSIGKPLPKRTNIVLAADGCPECAGCVVSTTLDEALREARAREKEEIFVIGGAQVYAATIGMADRLYLTLVKKDFAGDAFFPDYSAFTKAVSERPGEHGDTEFTFLVLEHEESGSAEESTPHNWP